LILVRQAADQVAIRLLLLEQALLARDLQLLIDVAEFDQQRGIVVSTGDTVHVRCSLPLAADAELDLLFGVGGSAHHRLGNRAE
jgi:hypothetical protein